MLLHYLRITSAALALLAGMTADAYADALSPDKIEDAINSAYDRYQDLDEGAVADYIPALAKVDPDF